MFEDALAEIEELLILEGAESFVGPEDFVFDLLELGRDETLGIAHGLLAGVFGRGLFEVTVRDLDEVTEDRVVLDLQRGDPGARLFAGLEIGDPLFPLGRGSSQLVDRLAVAVGEDATVFQ